MTRKSFQARLTACLDDGRMTVSDLSRWFDRPYSTVSKWVMIGREPWGPNGAHADELLAQLEILIKLKRRFPIPYHLTPTARISYIAELKRDARISSTRSAK